MNLQTSIVLADGSAQITFDSATEDYSPRIDWTEHPVETGTDVTDHAQIKPIDFTIRGLVTETPLPSSSPLLLSPAVPQRGAERVKFFYDFFNNAQGKVVVVATARWGIFSSCGITSFRHGVDAKGRVVFTVGIRQIRIAQSATATIPAISTSLPGASSAGNVGAQAISAGVASNADKANRLRTTAAALDDVVGGWFPWSKP